MRTLPFISLRPTKPILKRSLQPRMQISWSLEYRAVAYALAGPSNFLIMGVVSESDWSVRPGSVACNNLEQLHNDLFRRQPLPCHPLSSS